jgi:hypothetical protein
MNTGLQPMFVFIAKEKLPNNEDGSSSISTFGVTGVNKKVCILFSNRKKYF